MSQKDKSQKKYHIDASSRFYPLYATKTAQSNFRISAKLNSVVDSAKLQQAQNEVLDRFSFYRAKLVKGFFWHMLKPISGSPDVCTEWLAPTTAITYKKNKGFMFRFIAFENEIALDFCHILADGRGASEFFKTVVARYLELTGSEVDWTGVIHYESTSADDEQEDSFTKNFKPFRFKDIDLKTMKGGEVTNIKGTLNESAATYTITASASNVKEVAKSLGASVNNFLSALLLMAILSESKHEKPIVMMVPIDARRTFNSKTLRNFVMFGRIIIDGKVKHNLDSLIAACDTSIKNAATKEALTLALSTIVRTEKTWIFGYAPLFMKIIYLRIGKMILKSRQTIIFSNIGVLPKFSNDIEKVSFSVNVNDISPFSAGAITYGNNLTVNFTSRIKEMNIAEKFENLLNEFNINTKNEYRG